jgi:hypothetical protein
MLDDDASEMRFETLCAQRFVVAVVVNGRIFTNNVPLRECARTRKRDAIVAEANVDDQDPLPPKATLCVNHPPHVPLHRCNFLHLCNFACAGCGTALVHPVVQRLRECQLNVTGDGGVRSVTGLCQHLVCEPCAARTFDRSLHAAVAAGGEALASFVAVVLRAIGRGSDALDLIDGNARRAAQTDHDDADGHGWCPDSSCTHSAMRPVTAATRF